MDYYSRKNPGGGGHQGHGMGFLGRGIEKFQGPIKKKVAFPRLIKIKSRGIFMGFGFWSMNIQKGFRKPIGKHQIR